MASFSPTRRLRSVDFPEFGRPTRETKPARRGTWHPGMGASPSSRMQQAFPEPFGQSFAGRGEEATFAAVHEVGFDGITVIVADEMEEAVSDEKLELEAERYAETAGLSLGGIDRNHDLADETSSRFGNLQREGQDIRPPPDAAESPIEPSDLRVVDDRDLDVASLATGTSERPPGGTAERINGDGNAALTVVDDRAH